MRTVVVGAGLGGLSAFVVAQGCTYHWTARKGMDPPAELLACLNTLTEEIWRLSLGLGYRWSQNLLVKAEYSFERGKELGGKKRNHEDLFGIEAAFKF